METYLGVELELDKVSRCCLHRVWIEVQRAVGAADLDDVRVDHSIRHASGDASCY